MPPRAWGLYRCWHMKPRSTTCKASTLLTVHFIIAPAVVKILFGNYVSRCRPADLTLFLSFIKSNRWSFSRMLYPSTTYSRSHPDPWLKMRWISSLATTVCLEIDMMSKGKLIWVYRIHTLEWFSKKSPFLTVLSEHPQKSVGRLMTLLL